MRIGNVWRKKVDPNAYRKCAFLSNNAEVCWRAAVGVYRSSAGLSEQTASCNEQLDMIVGLTYLLT